MTIVMKMHFTMSIMLQDGVSNCVCLSGDEQSITFLSMLKTDAYVAQNYTM